MNYKELRDRILAATDNGKQIMDDYLPEIIFKVQGKKFSIREGDNTPSSCLYPPNPEYKGPGWHVKDFGGKWYSAVDIYMLNRGYNDDQFMMALYDLAEQYGASYKLDPKINVRHFTSRDALSEEMGMPPHFDFFDELSAFNLGRIFTPDVKAEHLEAYGWHAVKKLTYITPKGKFVEITADPATYPAFAQECHYADDKGNDLLFYKIYEPFSSCFPQDFVLKKSSICK